MLLLISSTFRCMTFELNPGCSTVYRKQGSKLQNYTCEVWGYLGRWCSSHPSNITTLRDWGEGTFGEAWTSGANWLTFITGHKGSSANQTKEEYIRSVKFCSLLLAALSTPKKLLWSSFSSAAPIDGSWHLFLSPCSTHLAGAISKSTPRIHLQYLSLISGQGLTPWTWIYM